VDSYWQLVRGALALDPAAFEAIQHAEHGLRQALLIMLVAGASETLGQSVVLVLNRVSRRRFALAVLLGGLELVVEALLWIASVWVLTGLFQVERPAFNSAVRVMGLAYAPLLLGVFVFFPYLGPAIGRLLRVWVLLAAVVGISVTFDLPPRFAAVIAAVGFLGRWLLLRAVAGIAEAANRWFWRASTGRATPLRSSDSLLGTGPKNVR
jgi:hypothetical protein